VATARLSVLGKEVAAVIVHPVQTDHPDRGISGVVGVDGPPASDRSCRWRSAKWRNSMTRVARCCCGSLQAEAVADPVFVGACHCKKCQWRTGAPFDVSASFRKADVSTNGLSTAYVRNTLAPVSLSRSHFPRRPNRQLQYLAERRQILVTWPAVISLPEVNARCAHADLLGNFHHRETTLDPRVTEITRETWLTRQ
jgi:hypothetical protein